MKKLSGALGAVVVLAALGASAETLPPAPARYFNDYAALVPPADAERLNAKLAAFDEQSSNQVVVAIFPELPSPSLEDFTVRTAHAWKAGRGKLDNGVVLFVFVKDRKVRLEVGYGLEGALPDAVAKRIIEEQITPAFRANQPARGLEAGIDAIIAVTRGEYKAEARPQRRPTGTGGATLVVIFLLLLPLFVIGQVMGRRMPVASYGSTGYNAANTASWLLPFLAGTLGSRRRRGRRSTWGGGGWGGGGGGWGGGGGGGGGFSGGGGGFGGGGASGSW
jgi:uncharacterized protein